MNSLVFFVEGSAPQPYRVAFTRYGRHLEITCTCSAGEKRSNCKHRMNLIAGDITSLVTGSSDSIEHIPAILDGSDVADAMAAIEPLARNAERAAAALHNPRAALGRVMNKSLSATAPDATPHTVCFLIKGSDPNPYTVTFSRHEDLLEASCTCRAGVLKKLACKHRMNLIDGTLAKVVFAPGSSGDPAHVPALVAGTDVAQKIADLRAFEAAAARADEALAAAKNYLTWVMNKTDATLLVDLAGTGYRAGTRARVEREQTKQTPSSAWTTMADHAFLLSFSTGGSVWVRPTEFDRDPPKPGIFG